MRLFIVKPTALKQILLTAFVLSLTVAGCASTEKADTTDPEQVYARNKATLRRYFDEIFNNRDLTNAHEYVSPTFKYSGTEAVDSSNLDLEKKGYIKFFKRIFALMEGKWEEPKVEVKEIVAEGNKAVVSYTATGLFYPGEKGRTEQNAVGVPLIVNGMSLYDFDEDGLILKVHSVEDSGPIVKAEMEYAQKKQSDLESRNKEQAKCFYAEFISAQDISKAGEFLSPHFTMDDRGDDGVQEKPKDPIEHFRVLFKLIAEGSSEFILTPDEMVAEDNTVAVRWHQTALLRPKEPVEQNPVTKRLNWTGTSFLEFDQNGLIVRAQVIQIEDKAKEKSD